MNRLIKEIKRRHYVVKQNICEKIHTEQKAAADLHLWDKVL